MNLDGLNGIVYFMLLGRETYARDIAQDLIRTKFIKDEDSIYPVIKKLKNSKLIEETRSLKGVPGSIQVCLIGHYDY